MSDRNSSPEPPTLSPPTTNFDKPVVIPYRAQDDDESLLFNAKLRKTPGRLPSEESEKIPKYPRLHQRPLHLQRPPPNFMSRMLDPKGHETSTRQVPTLSPPQSNNPFQRSGLRNSETQDSRYTQGATTQGTVTSSQILNPMRPTQLRQELGHEGLKQAPLIPELIDPQKKSPLLNPSSYQSGVESDSKPPSPKVNPRTDKQN